MERLVGLRVEFETQKAKYTLLERARCGVLLVKKVSRQNGKVSYCVGHVVVVKGDFTDDVGRSYQAEEVFVVDEMHDSERDARQAFAKAVLKAERETAAA